MEFHTKAQTLEYISKRINHSYVLPSLIIHSHDFLENKEQTVIKVQLFFGKYAELIVRSSSGNEDCQQYSNAGKYVSVLSVKRSSAAAIEKAIEKVISSYKNNLDEEILIQPMLSNVLLSGVVFTRDLCSHAPYYTINYSESGNTAAVTSGKQEDLKTSIVYKKNQKALNDPIFQKIILGCSEIEKCVDNDALDIEFAIDKKKVMYIFQVRPITVAGNNNVDLQKLDNALSKIYKKTEKLMRPHPFLLGKTTCFGVMPDWNPAEILGVRPKKLAISLYKELITDNIWAHQRSNYGYRDLTMQPLMVSFCGIPYIDTRVTFNSFIPAELNTDIAEKLVDYYEDRLLEYPAYHDKIEFKIVYSCYYPGLPQKIEKLREYGFNENERKRIEFSLLNLTNKIIHPINGLYKKDIQKAQLLPQKYNDIMNSDISTVDKIYWLLEECKTYGTLPFAGIARAAFIAMQFLEAFVEEKIISEKERNDFLVSLNLLSGQINTDRCKMSRDEMTKETFLSKYGYIRPGTYDILTPRYDEAFEHYFGKSDTIETGDEEKTKFELSSQSRDKLQHELDQNGIQVTAEELICFIREAIEERENSKYIFTKCVSEILQQIVLLGERNSISREEMAYLDISVIKQLYVDLYYDNLSDLLRRNIEENRLQYECAEIIKLPSLLTKPDDVYYYTMLQDEPNFITKKTTEAETITGNITETGNVSGKIVFIESADPGYDYIFSQSIAGLVTQFGGANSHMAIRCAEMEIPAVIGAGENNFREWSRCRKLRIECGNRRVIKI